MKVINLGYAPGTDTCRSIPEAAWKEATRDIEFSVIFPNIRSIQEAYAELS